MKDATLGQVPLSVCLELLQIQVQARLLEMDLLADLRDGNIERVDRNKSRRLLRPGPVDDVFPVTVDYSWSLEKMIERGRYDWVNKLITKENFPHDTDAGVREVDTELFHFDKSIGTDKRVFAKMKKFGYRHASVEELLAFGGRYPKEQRKYLIVAFGSRWWDPYGGRCVVCLYEDADDERFCGLHWLDGDWGWLWRRLVVRV